MTVTIIMTEEEERLVNDYAKAHSLSLEEALKKAVREKIEEEYGIYNIMEIPNEITIAAMEEGRRIKADKNACGYKSADELRAALELD